MTATEVSVGVRSDGWRWASAEQPYVYEINTWPWLNQLSVEAGRSIDLSTVPDERWAALADAGFDAVWLMGVWARSPAGSAIALDNEELVESFQAVLPDYRPEDVVGSPYCVRDYEVDPRLGGRDGLARARAALARHGLGLILDFVPNHVAPDHLWTRTNPELFVRGSSQELEDDPGSFVAIDGSVLARGRDPYFPAWPDVVQLNAFAPALRTTVIATLRDIAEQCDGVRCDMAMLMMNDVFSRTWGARVGAPPADDYWPTVIPAVRDAHPGFRFIAEAYWDLEWALQQQGFDFCYDKRLYDRLVAGEVGQIRPHLSADRHYQQRLVRFIENHDEPRAAAVFDDRRQRAAAVATLTQTGARLVHDGQFDGRKVRLPVFLGRYPDEPTDRELSAFYQTPARGIEGSHLPHRHLGALRMHGMARQRHHRQSRGLVLGRRKSMARRGQPQRRRRQWPRTSTLERPPRRHVHPHRPDDATPSSSAPETTSPTGSTYYWRPGAGICSASQTT